MKAFLFGALIGYLSLIGKVQASPYDFKNLCGVGPLKEQMTGTFTSDGKKGTISAEIPKTGVKLNQGFTVVEEASEVLDPSIPKHQRIIKVLESNLQISGAQKVTRMELLAVNELGEPTSLNLSDRMRASSAFQVQLVSYQNIKTALIFSFRNFGESDSKTTFPFFLGTDDCGSN